MSSIVRILLAGAILSLLIYLTHSIRTWAFGRHEAVTFECSAAACLISLLLLPQLGWSLCLIPWAAGLFAAFLVNAFTQWFFYMKLQDNMKGAFGKRASYLNTLGSSDPQGTERAKIITDTLQTMASVAVMPSFSRFLEESKFFNDPGSFIGLVKSILRRQRFQKKKFQMRECFARIVNLLCPCKPMIGSAKADAAEDKPAGKIAGRKPAGKIAGEAPDQKNSDGDTIPGVLHANELALNYTQEKIGLAVFDVLGFGAAIWIWHGLDLAAKAETAPGAGLQGLWYLLLLPLFAWLDLVLRRRAFARYESFGYELSFASLMAVAFCVLRTWLAGRPIAVWAWVVLGLVFGLFLLSSFLDHLLDKRLHARIDRIFVKLIEGIPPKTETNRATRTILKDLRTISAWALVPFTDTDGPLERPVKKLPEGKRKQFRELVKKKDKMPELMEKILAALVPEHKPDIPENTFFIKPDDQKKAQAAMMIIGSLGVAAVVAAACWGVL